MKDLRKRPDENKYEYVWRICQMKENGEQNMSWSEVASLLNSELCLNKDEYKGEAAYRKPYQGAKAFYDNVFAQQASNEYIQELRDAKNELFMERVRLRDERTEMSRQLREKARQENFIEAVRRVFVEDIEPFPAIEVTNHDATGNEMIVHLTDVHAGLGISNSVNQYDTTIMRDRLIKYAAEVKKIALMHKCDACTVVLGGDMISGLIHASIRVENTENVIEQTKRVCNYIAEFLKAINVFNSVRVVSVSGNHSRLSPNKDNQVTGEELDALIPFYLKAVFADYRNYLIQDNACGDYIATFDVCGRHWVAVHGDKDNPSTVAQHLTKLLGYIPDGILIGHRHTNGMITDGFTKVIQSGCVCGTDRYAYDKRLVGNPEQMVIITDRNNTVKCLYDIQL